MIYIAAGDFNLDLVPCSGIRTVVNLQQGGSVNGILRDPLGMPVAGVRIAAVARADELTDVSLGTLMASLGVTDEQGRFTLENIPPGRYVIVAGRIDIQTFYPGTVNAAEATILTVASDSTIRGINFILATPSFERLTFPHVRVTGPQYDNWARLAAYQDIVWPEGNLDTPRVLLNGVWYGLLSIENVPVKELIEFARLKYADLWQKRFEEDMVEILAGTGRPSKGNVSLGVRDLESGIIFAITSPMNQSNHTALLNAKGGRTGRTNAN